MVNLRMLKYYHFSKGVIFLISSVYNPSFRFQAWCSQGGLQQYKNIIHTGKKYKNLYC